MKLFVQVTFDLEDAQKAEYVAIEGWLNQIGLRRIVEVNDGHSLQLPNNTFAGFRDCYLTADEAVEYIRKQFDLSAWDSCQGRALISVSPADATKYDIHVFGLK